jgi:hypothetical protein
MAASTSPRMGVTADEVVHLTGGYSYWKFNDYRLHPENGTLPMRVAALPVVAMDDVKFPALTEPTWIDSKVNLIGEIFFYRIGNPLAEMLQRGRAAIALFGVLTCWLTWRWARGLFGRAAGGLALVLAVFCPALLAHGGLITSDLAFTACALAALSAVWRLLHRATWWRLLGAAAACGACFLSKMSGSIIVPLIAVLWLLRALRPAPYVLALGRARWLRRRGQVMLATFGLLVAAAAGSLVLVWANYGFRYEGPDRAGRPSRLLFSLGRRPRPGEGAVERQQLALRIHPGVPHAATDRHDEARRLPARPSPAARGVSLGLRPHLQVRQGAARLLHGRISQDRLGAVFPRGLPDEDDAARAAALRRRPRGDPVGGAAAALRGAGEAGCVAAARSPTGPRP